jgi:hypothetical protein
MRWILYQNENTRAATNEIFKEKGQCLWEWLNRSRRGSPGLIPLVSVTMVLSGH